jgi:hypothetical protein
MKFSTLILAGAVALGGTAAFAQSDSSGSGSTAGSQSGGGTSIVEKAKSGMHKLGTATKHALSKVTGKGKQDTQASGSGASNTSTMGASGSSSGAGDSSSGSGKSSKHQQR